MIPERLLDKILGQMIDRMNYMGVIIEREKIKMEMKKAFSKNLIRVIKIERINQIDLKA